MKMSDERYGGLESFLSSLIPLMAIVCHTHQNIRGVKKFG